jgi:hypothetical protein
MVWYSLKGKKGKIAFIDLPIARKINSKFNYIINSMPLLYNNMIIVGCCLVI